MSLKDPKLRAAYQRKWERDNKPRLLEKRRVWALANRDKCNASSREWRKNNLARRKAIQARSRNKNRESYRASSLKYYQSNKQKCAASRKKWAANNPGYWARNSSRRLKTDLPFKLLMALRRRLLSALRRNTKSGKTIELLGCSIDNFRIYLESKFAPGMNWENYGKGAGKWNIDHIMPCAIFDLSRPEHQRRCFHFSNMQPLWWEDNATKSDKVLTNQFALL